MLIIPREILCPLTVGANWLILNCELDTADAFIRTVED